MHAYIQTTNNVHTQESNKKNIIQNLRCRTVSHTYKSFTLLHACSVRKLTNKIGCPKSHPESDFRTYENLDSDFHHFYIHFCTGMPTLEYKHNTHRHTYVVHTYINDLRLFLINRRITTLRLRGSVSVSTILQISSAKPPGQTQINIGPSLPTIRLMNSESLRRGPIHLLASSRR